MAIPVLGFPVLNRYDHAENMVKSIDVPVDRMVIVDNGGKYKQGVFGAHVISPGANLGWGASINLMMRTNLQAPWWFFTNDDMIFCHGDLAEVEKFMQNASGPTIGMMDGCGFAAFCVNPGAIEAVGWFDESYHPAYCEDCDWGVRASRLGIQIHEIPGHSIHIGSQTIRGEGTNNDRTYQRNVAYHRAKWGGGPREEVFATPFDKGGDPSITVAPKLSRLRDLSW